MKSRMPAVALDKMMAFSEEVNIGEFTILLEAEFSHQLDSDRLARALEFLLDAEPILATRFVAHWYKPYWENVSWDIASIFTETSSKEKYDCFRNSPLLSRKGPQINLCLYKNHDGDHLLIKLHHQVGDAEALKSIAKQLSSIYRHLKSNAQYHPKTKTHYDRGIWKIFKGISVANYFNILCSSTKLLWSLSNPSLTHTLPLPKCPESEVEYIIKHYPAWKGGNLKSFAKNQGVTLNDVLLAAFFRAQVSVGNWDGKSMLRVQTIVNLYSWYLKDIAPSISNTVSSDYVSLKNELGDNFMSTLARVYEATKNRKKNWLGLTDICFMPFVNILPYKIEMWCLEKINSRKMNLHNLPNTFSNAGIISEEMLLFDKPAEHGWILTVKMYSPLLVGCVTSYRDEFTFVIGTSVQNLKIVDQFINQWIAELSF